MTPARSPCPAAGTNVGRISLALFAALLALAGPDSLAADTPASPAADTQASRPAIRVRTVHPRRGADLSMTVEQPADVAATVQQAADDLVALSKTNRDLLIDMIRGEVDKAVGRMGFVREDELAAVRARVEKLEKQVAAQSTSASTSTAPATSESTVSASASPSAASAAEPPKKKKVIVSE